VNKLLNKGLVLLSGGQDSATCLAWSSIQFDQVYTMSFNYGQRHVAELECSKILSEKAGAVKHYEVPVSSLKYLAENGSFSALLGKGDISTNHPSRDDLPASFVPGRNYIFLGLAGALASQLGIKNIITGVCQTDFSGYPDCRDLSIKAIQVALFLCLDFNLTIHTPLMWKTKAETVMMMRDLGKFGWYKHTMTCYEGQSPPCGKCPACLLRAKGFKEVGFADPIY